MHPLHPSLKRLFHPGISSKSKPCDIGGAFKLFHMNFIAPGILITCRSKNLSQGFRHDVLDASVQSQSIIGRDFVRGIADQRQDGPVV